MIRLTVEQWKAIAVEKFGEDRMHWTYQCPRCGTRQTAALFLWHRIEPKGLPYKRCIGRHVPGIGACDYSLVDPVAIRLPHLTEILDPKTGEWQPVFEFADLRLTIELDASRLPKPPEPPRFISRHTRWRN